jgi:hypothetical protein
VPKISKRTLDLMENIADLQAECEDAMIEIKELNRRAAMRIARLRILSAELKSAIESLNGKE